MNINSGQACFLPETGRKRLIPMKAPERAADSWHTCVRSYLHWQIY